MDLHNVHVRMVDAREIAQQRWRSLALETQIVLALVKAHAEDTMLLPTVHQSTLYQSGESFVVPRRDVELAIDPILGRSNAAPRSDRIRRQIRRRSHDHSEYEGCRGPSEEFVQLVFGLTRQT